MNELDKLDIGIPSELNDGQRHVITEILLDGFRDKFMKIFGDELTVFRLLSKSLNPQRLVIARIKGNAIKDYIVGIAGLSFENHSWLRIDPKDVIRIGVFKTLRMAFLGIPLMKRPLDKEMLIDVVAVAKTFRGRGIGTRILYYIIDLARKMKIEKIKLYVVEHNERAKKLYERIGFVVTRRVKIRFPWNKLLGFNYLYELIYHL